MKSTEFRERVEERIREWKVIVQETLETPSSFVAFGLRNTQPVVLKVIRQCGDEWHCGEVLAAFDCRGMVRTYEYVDGAVLLERLNPGTSLAPMALKGRDENATEIIAEVLQRMVHPSESPHRAVPVVQAWGKGFQRYVASGDTQIPRRLTEKGERWYGKLCATQQKIRLLHGDLLHYNILLDQDRGWMAIDPKGVMGEIEYEIGASLRNPGENPEVWVSKENLVKRLAIYERKLQLNAKRALGWGFAQAVLSAIWTVEDEGTVATNNAALLLAKVIEPMLE